MYIYIYIKSVDYNKNVIIFFQWIAIVKDISNKIIILKFIWNLDLKLKRNYLMTNNNIIYKLFIKKQKNTL